MVVIKENMSDINIIMIKLMIKQEMDSFNEISRSFREMVVIYLYEHAFLIMSKYI